MSKLPETDYLIITDGGGFRKENKEYDASSAFLIFHRPDARKQRMDQSAHLDSAGMVTPGKTMAYGEMCAIALALERILPHIMALPEKERKLTTIRVYTDSNNCYMTLTAWIYSWLKYGGDGFGKPFRNREGKIVMHQDAIMRAFVTKSQLQELGAVVKFYHINSHTAKKNRGDTRLLFQQYNDCLISKEDFYFIHEMNKVCDALVKETYYAYKETGNRYNEAGVKQYYR